MKSAASKTPQAISLKTTDPMLTRMKQERPDREKRSLLSSLPLELLAVVLQHVPLEERLKVCAILSSRCKAAAVKATNSITLHAAQPTKVFRLLTWLKSYGSGVTSIDLQPTIVTRPMALLELPNCAGLRSLTLTDALVQLTAGSQQLGVLHSCKALTSLSLRNCNVLDTSAQLAGLSVLKDLHELRIVLYASCIRRVAQPPSLLPGRLLSQLVKLTSIDLSSPMRFEHLQHLTCLTGLQKLRELPQLLEVELSSAWAQNQALQDATKQLELQVTKLCGEKEAAAIEIAAKEKQIAAREKAVKAAQHAVYAREARLQRQANDIAAKESRVAARSAELDEAELDEATARLHAARNAVSKGERRVTAQSAELDAARARLQTGLASLDAREQHVIVREQAVANAEARLSQRGPVPQRQQQQQQQQVTHRRAAAQPVMQAPQMQTPAAAQQMYRALPPAAAQQMYRARQQLMQAPQMPMFYSGPGHYYHY